MNKSLPVRNAPGAFLFAANPSLSSYFKLRTTYQKSVILSEAPKARSRRIYALSSVLSNFSVRRSFDSGFACAQDDALFKIYRIVGDGVLDVPQRERLRVWKMFVRIRRVSRPRLTADTPGGVKSRFIEQFRNCTVPSPPHVYEGGGRAKRGRGEYLPNSSPSHLR